MYHTIISVQMQLLGFTWLSEFDTTTFCTVQSQPMAYLPTGLCAPSVAFTQKMVTVMCGQELEQRQSKK